MRRAALGVVLLLVFLVVFASCDRDEKVTDTSQPKDYKSKPWPKVTDTDFGFKEVTVDKFPGMNGVTVTDPEHIRGRIVWNLWSNDSWKMWDFLAKHGYGTSDLIKTLDSRNRGVRFQRIGTINQPGYMQAVRPDQYGLWLDVPNPSHPAGKFDEGIDPKTYGRSSGVVGLRIYDNPAFTGAARDAWMQRINPATGVNDDYYTNEAYFQDKNLVRPYAVGMACSFCHVSFDPIRPPANVNEPEWSNLNDFIGAQYLKVWEVFMPRLPNQPADHFKESYVWQLLRSNPPGTLDTSFIATDHINNPGTMNGVFNVPERVAVAALHGDQKLAGGALDLLGVKEDMPVPAVLKQGDDSVGFEAALSRVYVNIGENWDEWSKHFRPIVGGPRVVNGKLASGQEPVPVKNLQKLGTWNWSEQRSPMLRDYFIAYAKPLLLKDAPGGAAYLTTDQNLLNRGKVVFAQECATCHSSKQPPKGTEPKKWFVDQVTADPNFFNVNNFLADERPYSVAEIGTNAARAAATNAKAGQIWDNFSSLTYKQRAPIAPITVTDPVMNKKVTFQIPGGGPGYYRPPSLISLWTSAPFLHNNTVGPREPADPSVAGRMRAFQDSIERLLLIKPRENIVWRTSHTTYLFIPESYAGPHLQKLIIDPKLKEGANYKIGPIPKGMPVSLLSNVDPNADPLKLAAVGISLTRALLDIKLHKMNDAQATARLRETVPRLIAVNKCPDFVMDRGHTFGAQLPPDDKKALIEVLKTF